MKRKFIPTLAAVAVIFAGNAAFAHARLEKADPAAGSMPTAPVAHIDLYFSEALEPAFSRATLSDEKGNPVASASSVDAGDPQHLVIVPTSPLTDGTFKVEWKAVSTDTHKTQGNFQFMVMP